MNQYKILLNKNGFIITAKRGMKWSRFLKPKIRFSLKNFFKSLKEYDGKKSNIFELSEAKILTKKLNLQYQLVPFNRNLIKFINF